MMQTYELKWLPAAKTDMMRLYDFIATFNPEAAARAVDTILDGVEILKAHPGIGQAWEPDPRYREIIIPFASKAYIIRYKVKDRDIVIVRVWHGLENRP